MMKRISGGSVSDPLDVEQTSRQTADAPPHAEPRAEDLVQAAAPEADSSLFPEAPAPCIATDTLPPPPQTIEEMSAALAKRERQISAIQRLGSIFLIRTTDCDRLMKQTLYTAIEILDADVGSVQLYDDKTDSLIFRHVYDPAAQVLAGYSVPISKGIDGRVFRTGVADLTNRVTVRKEWNGEVDSRTGYHTESMLTVPIKKQDGSRMGVIQVLNGKRPFDRRDLEVLEVLCSQAGQAMINAHLYEDAQRRLDHLQALRSIDIAITASLDLHITLDVFVEQVIMQLKVDAVNVLLLNPHMLTLEYSASRGFHSEALRHTNLRLGEGLAGRAALERRVISIPNLNETHNDLLRSPHLRDEGFVTYFAVPLIAKGQVKGVLETFHRTRLEPDPEWLSFLETLAGQAAIAVDNAALFNDLQSSNTELHLAYDTTIEGWSCALDLRDKETEGHTLRVTELTTRLARAMGINDTELVHVRRGALLHDIGKMGIPDSILLKPGPLTDEEWVIMKKHPVYALDLLSRIPYLRPALDIPYYHHEKWDGSGYPCKLKGEQIPLSARIFAVADVWDALRSDRPYRAGWPEEKARQHIISEAGKHFDPKVIEVFQSLDVDHLNKPYSTAHGS
jgi:putative nucleotidyltransferase with HDIG domain